MSRISLVKFTNGKWGIRRWSIFEGFEYRDFDPIYSFGTWLSKTSAGFGDCQVSEEEARRYFEAKKAEHMEDLALQASAKIFAKQKIEVIDTYPPSLLSKIKAWFAEHKSNG